MALIIIAALCAGPLVLLLVDILRVSRRAARFAGPARGAIPLRDGRDESAAVELTEVEPLDERRTSDLAFVGADRRVAASQPRPVPAILRDGTGGRIAAVPPPVDDQAARSA